MIDVPGCKDLDVLLDEARVSIAYITGSYVSGYGMADSDIDIVGVTTTHEGSSPIALRPNLSVHLIHPMTFEMFETGIPYSHLAMVPLRGEGRVQELSRSMKHELVRRELIRFSRAGKSGFTAWDIVRNYLLGYGLERPWRILPIRRALASNQTVGILSREYAPILEGMVDEGVLEVSAGNFSDEIGIRYDIRKDHVFDERFGRLPDQFLFSFKNSYAGWYYVREFSWMLRFSKRRV